MFSRTDVPAEIAWTDQSTPDMEPIPRREPPPPTNGGCALVVKNQEPRTGSIDRSTTNGRVAPGFRCVEVAVRIRGWRAALAAAEMTTAGWAGGKWYRGFGTAESVPASGRVDSSCTATSRRAGERDDVTP